MSQRLKHSRQSLILADVISTMVCCKAFGKTVGLFYHRRQAGNGDTTKRVGAQYQQLQMSQWVEITTKEIGSQDNQFHMVRRRQARRQIYPVHTQTPYDAIS